MSPSRAKLEPTKPGCTALAVIFVSSSAARELAGEQHVGELGRAVHEEPAVTAALPVEVVEVEAVAGERVPGRRHVHDARGRRRRELVVEEPGQQVVAEVVHLELRLVAVFGDRALRAR